MPDDEWTCYNDGGPRDQRGGDEIEQRTREGTTLINVIGIETEAALLWTERGLRAMGRREPDDVEKNRI